MEKVELIGLGLDILGDWEDQQNLDIKNEWYIIEVLKDNQVYLLNVDEKTEWQTQSENIELI